MKITEIEQKHLAAVRPYLSECMVILKKSGAFPLNQPCSIALYGNGARHTAKGGLGSGEVNSRFFVSVEQGLIDAGYTITSGKWLDAYDRVLTEAEKAFIRKTAAEARTHHTQTIIEGMGKVMIEPDYDLAMNDSGDACIYVLARTSGEGADRTLEKGDYLLTESEIRDIRALNQKYEKFMLVLNTCGPVDLSAVKDCKDILLLSQPGTETGAALADVLLGKAMPSGRLSAQWLAAEDVKAIQEFGCQDDTRYLEGIYEGYRGTERNHHKPLFPFGFGLSYTDFSWKMTGVKIRKSIVTVSAEVCNTGNNAGKEVLEAYLSCPSGKLDKPLRTLVSFGKTTLIQPGGSASVSLSFDVRNSASFDSTSHSWILESGTYVVSFSDGSDDIKPVFALRIAEDTVVKQACAVFGDCGFEDWKPEGHDSDSAEDLPVYEISTADLKMEPVSAVKETVDPRIASLREEELALLNIGAFQPKKGVASIIGTASNTVAGAAGDICALYEKLCGKTLVMADGPAGLRLSSHYFTDEKGVHALDSSLPASYTRFLSKFQRLVMSMMMKKPGRNAEIKEQYTTMIPIATAIAQSWNPDAVEVFGSVVAEEMKQYGVRLWLAPAMNIQRNPLCGRNYEYYSEDPYLSAMTAAGMVRGVQKKGGYVVLKHFACNNQETNRCNNSAQVSERALREIYLKGFELVIEMEHPHAIMTSYNLINGVHTSESRALCTDYLRKECGFDGIVMTDWVTATDVFSKHAKYPAPCADKVCMAGNDLFMPGSTREYKQIMEGLKKGTVTRKQLEMNATRVLKVCEGGKNDA